MRKKGKIKYNYGDGKKKPVWMWDYYGSCSPENMITVGKTFSVGIFQWIPTKKRNDVKRGKVIKRIKGLSSNPYPVYNIAGLMCDIKNGIKNEN